MTKRYSFSLLEPQRIRQIVIAHPMVLHGNAQIPKFGCYSLIYQQNFIERLFLIIEQEPVLCVEVFFNCVFTVLFLTLPRASLSG